jgi:uncharacterized protein (TIGR03032 family)
LGVSLLVTTYQAGKVVVIRSEGGTVNTHFRDLPAPMGLALHGDRLAVGTPGRVWEFRNLPALVPKLAPPAPYDGCFVPRSIHYTGDIQIHELAWVGDELWVVNTRFSCLAAIDREHSFVPRWRPPFVSALAPEDRCHLNGLGLRAGRPAYATALGRTDSAAGWRANKRDGGCLLDVTNSAIIADGLSMPHSPRWYADRLWMLESGRGHLVQVDHTSGRPEVVARLPGFTRGLDFAGAYAFIGLSQIRETAVFAGLPLTDRTEERKSGVWVVDLRSGTVAAFLQFECAVQEIFAVQVVPQMRFPELLVDDPLLASTYILPDDALAQLAPRGQ